MLPITHVSAGDSDFDLTLKEAVAASFLHQTHDRVTGANGFGDIILDGKPSKVLSAAFLLPANRAPRSEEDEIGQANDAVTPIHVATVGLAFQVAARPEIRVLVRPQGSIYVRMLPTEDELRARPIAFRLSQDLQRELAGLRREYVARARAANEELLSREGPASPEWRRIKAEAVRAAREELQRRISISIESAEPEATGEEIAALETVRAAVLAGQEPRGPALQVVDGLDVSVLEESTAQADASMLQTDEDGDQVETARLNVYPGKLDAPPDEVVLPAEVPQKWLRLEVDFPALEIDLALPPDSRARLLDEYAEQLYRAVQTRVANWERDPDPATGGQLWAFPAPDGRGSERFRPSQVAAWAKTLSALAQNAGLRHPRPEIRPVLEIEVADDPIAPGQRTVRVILRNASRVLDPSRPSSRCFEHGLFQVKLTCELDRTLHLPLVMERIRPSYRWNRWLSYPGIGINCGIEISRDPASPRVCLSTTYLPTYFQPRIEAFRINPAPRFDRLAQDDGGIDVLKALASEYSAWIQQTISLQPWRTGLNPSEDPASIERERRAFESDLECWRRELLRINKGIAVLEHSFAKARGGVPLDDPEVVPLSAWRAMNSSFSTGGYPEWRLFQLAFILSHLAGLVSRIPYWSNRTDIMSENEQLKDDSTASLLYFPTGGGKSEAFFGVLVLALFLDRLRGKHRGVTAMVRYPLRLLTAQQANRFAQVLAKAERVKRAFGIPGEPFHIGFWVGSGNTPNSPADEGFEQLPKWEDGITDEENLRDSDRAYGSVLRWKRLTSCPFCGNSKIGLRSRREAGTRRLVHACFNSECQWNQWHGGIEPLPFHIMDTDVYAYSPSVLLGTVDKMAMIGHSARTIAKVFGMFGLAPWQYIGSDSNGCPKPGAGRLIHPSSDAEFRRGPNASECRRLWPVYPDGAKIFFDPFPSVVVQDEAHLLEESLGTFSGLFETMFEAAVVDLAPLLQPILVSIGGKPRRYKVIAASATVSEPLRQIRMLYQREVELFPYPGPTLYESFFARLKEPSAADSGRNTEDDPETRTPAQRIYASMPTNGKPHTSATVAILSAFHLAISDFFDQMLSDDPSRREFGRKRLLRHLPRDRFFQWRSASLGRATDDQLAEAVDLHRIAICYVTNKKGGDNVKATLYEFTQRDHKRAGISFGVRGGIRTDLITGAIEMDGIQKVVEEAKPEWQVGDPFDRNRDVFDALRGIVATSAISHGVDVERFNSMFFAGLPSDIAEYIQASSRIGRIHVGFSVLIPTPQVMRDMHVVEIHHIFHRFLERMVQPAPVDRWAERAILRVLSSALMIKACAIDHYRSLVRAAESEKASTLPSDRIARVRSRYSGDAVQTVSALRDYFERAIGLSADRLSYRPGSAEWYLRELENRTRRWVNEMGNPMFGNSGLRTFFENVSAPLPMTSLRDVDDAGVIRASERRQRGLTRLGKREVRDLMRILRQGGAAWGEGEDDVTDSAERE